MQRYFFTVHDGTIIPDTEGSMLTGPVEARAEAAATVFQLLKDRCYSQLWDGEEWKVVVTDESGAIVLTLRFNASTEAGPGIDLSRDPTPLPSAS